MAADLYKMQDDQRFPEIRIDKLEFARFYERCRMEQLGGWELAHRDAHIANSR